MYGPDIDHDPIVSYEEDAGEAGISSALAVARVQWGPEARTTGWGRAASAELARLKALGEAVERHACAQPLPMRLARQADLHRVIDPAALVRYTAAQYATPGFPYKPVTVQMERWWVDALSRQGDKVAVLADCVLGAHVFPAAYREGLYTSPTSSGCASGLTLSDALLRGAMELVERDAFMRHWLGQQGGMEVHAGTLPASLRLRVQQMADLGLRTGVRYLDAGVYPACLVWAQHPTRHFTTIGSASGLDAEKALLGAWDELESGVLQNLLGVHDGAGLAASAVASPRDHAALYATAHYFQRADTFLAAAGSVPWSSVQRAFAGSEQAFWQHLADRQLEVYGLDLSLPQARGIADGRTIHTVRALIPGLIPIAFGARRCSLGMLSKINVEPDLIHPFA